MQRDSTCTVYSGDGGIRSRSTPLDAPAEPAVATSTIAADVSIRAIMVTRIVCARPDLPVTVLARLLVDRQIGCIPIVDDHGRPTGIVTKADLIEYLDGRARSGTAETAADVMMPLAITLDERATVADAAAMFASEDFHHIMIVSASGILVGIVSTKDVVRWLRESDRAALRE
jgi:CBS domain-containing protein